MKYIVKYEDIVLGEYNVYEDYVEYIVYPEGKKAIREKGYDILPMISKSFKGKSLPFFDNRIRNCKRFPGRKIGYHTDSVELEEMS